MQAKNSPCCNTCCKIAQSISPRELDNTSKKQPCCNCTFEKNSMHFSKEFSTTQTKNNPWHNAYSKVAQSISPRISTRQAWNNPCCNAKVAHCIYPNNLNITSKKQTLLQLCILSIHKFLERILHNTSQKQPWLQCTFKSSSINPFLQRILTRDKQETTTHVAMQIHK
jgi:hypothetical protein